MIPLIQGQLDGLCGVYSAINATRLVENLSREEALMLFREICRVIEGRKSLSGVIGYGIRCNDIAFFFKTLVQKQYALDRYKPFHKIKRLSLESYWGEIQGFLKTGDRRAVILVMESWDWAHWTVIRKATSKAFYLFDSDHSKILWRRHCTTGRLSKARPILLYPNLTYFLSRKENNHGHATSKK